MVKIVRRERSYYGTTRSCAQFSNLQQKIMARARQNSRRQIMSRTASHLTSSKIMASMLCPTRRASSSPATRLHHSRADSDTSSATRLGIREMSAAILSQPETVARSISSKEDSPLFLRNLLLLPSTSASIARILPLVAKKVEHGAPAPGSWSWSDGGDLADVDGLPSSSSSPV